MGAPVGWNTVTAIQLLLVPLGCQSLLGNRQKAEQRMAGCGHRSLDATLELKILVITNLFEARPPTRDRLFFSFLGLMRCALLCAK